MLELNKNRLIMPRGIRFINESDYTLEDFQFPHILDKKIPGCGYTEYCLTCNLPIILCSPRRILLENKEMQHLSEVFYFKNELDNELEVGKDLTKISITSPVLAERSIDNLDKDVISQQLSVLFDKLNNYLQLCIIHQKIPKILVTYDSFRLIKEYLVEHNIFNNFYVVVDEFQSIFIDSKFKSTTEMEFMDQLLGLQRVCYVSATPMLDKYLKMVDEFKNLPYYELDWESDDPSRITKPQLKARVIQSISYQAAKIIKTYKNNEFESSLDLNNNLVYSTEAVFYVNSVSNILSIIKKSNLRPEECNILCARTDYNLKKIHTRLGKEFEIGTVPLFGEPHKMFTFCTRTVYLGADFYSTCARTFILSDASIDSLAVDISLDLPQILGRQRLNENPWKNRAELYYKTLTASKKIAVDSFNEYINQKIDRTNSLLRIYNETTQNKDKHELAETYQKLAKTFNYRDDYIAVNTHLGSTLVPCLNNLVLISEQRAYDIQQVDYKDRFSVFTALHSSKTISEEFSEHVNQFLDDFNSFSNFREKIKSLCQSNLTGEELCVVLDQVPLTYKNYYLGLGPDRCKALNYEYTRIKKEYSDIYLFDKNNLKNNIYDKFIVGERYTNSNIKMILCSLYNELGYNKTAKATDLETYFIMKPCKVLVNNKYEHGFEIISKKGGES